MEYYKETIMGQVMKQVKNNKRNEIYFEQIDDLLDDISNLDYMDCENTTWNKLGLMITDLDISSFETDREWVYVETADVAEYSWLVEQLMEIYKPKIKDSYRLLTTIGYLLNIYGEQNESLSDILRLTAISSTVFLHPDHLGRDKFKVRPMSLPPFGREF